MKIEIPSPADIDGTPQEVAVLAVADAARVVLQLRSYLDDVQVQVRNAVMQDTLEAGDQLDPYLAWERSTEAKVTAAAVVHGQRLTTTLALLARIRAERVKKLAGEDAVG